MKSNMSDQTKQLKKIVVLLSKKEEQQAIKSVVTHMRQEYQRAVSETAPRFRILGLDRRVEKPQDRQSVPQRLIHVLVSDYTNKRNLVFVLNSNAEIIKTENYNGLQPVFHKEEIKEARTIAEHGDDRIGGLAKTRGTFVSTFAPLSNNSTDMKSRIIGLRYTSFNKVSSGFQSLARVLIDISDQKIISAEVEDNNREEIS
jgi:hypothetical protein